MPNNILRTLKAVLRTSLLFGVGLGIFSGTLIGLYVLIVAGPGVESLPERIGNALFAGIGMGVRFAIGGAAIGAFFAVALRLAYHGRRLAEVSMAKAALIGAVVGAVGIPLFYQCLNLISSGHTIAWGLVGDDAIWASIVGAAGGAGAIWMARRAAALPAEEEQGELGAGDAMGGMAGMREKERVRR